MENKPHINFYSLLIDPPKRNEIENDNDNNLLENSEIHNDNIFILDHKIKQERDKRINEKDKIYKIKKHYHLKESYSEITKQERFELEYNTLKEKEYIKNCLIAEEKLKEGEEIFSSDIYYLLKRNFPLFNKTQQNDINRYKNLYNAFNFASAVTSAIIISYIRSVMIYFKFEIRNKSVSFIFLTGYGIGIYCSLIHFLNKSYVKNIMPYCLRIKDKILDEDNEYLKTPYGEDEKIYDGNNIDEKSVFKI